MLVWANSERRTKPPAQGNTPLKVQDESMYDWKKKERTYVGDHKDEEKGQFDSRKISPFRVGEGGQKKQVKYSHKEGASHLELPNHVESIMY